ncbi:pyridoxamine 5'-phosphate oxidase family protein [Yinghuangia soli]|uniref:Pyridoxamine 5'-phosphate oxidase family protein n=1 Tax=Yinghuangia soli TaxID=2908204 RepID=A0AA41Q6D5_9ACTN|nr:pyridoxamine 5'-phosphate oxidase family protein [Yinghuangia soli]MCF2532420.1 pyridoxamine 5'-phosphate oxidase family protein [Yinghuangia soli]
MDTNRAPHRHELTKAEAMRLMARVRLGRVVFARPSPPGAVPGRLVRPAQYCVVDGRIVFRVLANPALTKALRRAPVAFEADERSAEDGAGWTVRATGQASRVASLTEAAAYERCLPPAWYEGAQMYRLDPEQVTGTVRT